MKLLRLLLLLSLVPVLNLYSQAPDPFRTVHIDNEYVTVWKTAVAPGEDSSLHHHDHARIVTALHDVTLIRIEQDGTRSELHFEKDVPVWLPADQPGSLHAEINETEDTVELLVTELKIAPHQHCKHCKH